MNRVLQKYQKTVVPAMQAKFGYKNVWAVPRLTKAVINVGVGRISKEEKLLETIEHDLATITGQKPLPTFAKKSIASFKLREGSKIGYKITLRGKKMYDFIDRLISIALPRTRDFRGISDKSFDAKNTLNLGITEQSIFPEIHYESLKDIFGLQVAIVTNSKQRPETVELFKLLGFPLINK